MYYLQPDALGGARVAIDPLRDVAVRRWELSDDVMTQPLLHNQTANAHASAAVFMPSA